MTEMWIVARMVDDDPESPIQKIVGVCESREAANEYIAQKLAKERLRYGRYIPIKTVML